MLEHVCELHIVRHEICYIAPVPDLVIAEATIQTDMST